MNKRFLLVAALCAAMNVAGFAQTNLALNKPIYPLGENSFRTSEELKVIDDGNEKGGMVELFKKVGDQKYFQDFYIDLGSEESIGQIAISWEGACAKDYKLYSGVKNGDEFTWTEIVNQEGLVGGGGADQIVKYNLSNVKTQYIKFAATSAHNEDWNVKMYEMSIYKAEAAALTSLKTSKSEVKVGEEFTVDVLDQFGKDFTGEYTLEAENAEPVEGKKNTFKALADGVVKVSVKDTEINTTINAYAPTIATLNVAQGFIMANEATELTFTAKDQQGDPFDLTNATYTADNGATFSDGKLTATKGGKTTITATVNGHKATAVVYALDASMAPNKPEVTADNAYGIYGQIANPDGKTASWQSWGGTNIDMEEITLGDTKVKPIQGGNKFNVGLMENAEKFLYLNNTDYDRAVMNIFSTADAKVLLESEGSKQVFNTIAYLKAGQWQSIELRGISREDNVIKCVNLLAADGATFPAILVSDIYLIKATGSANLTIGNTDANGFVSVTGTITTNDLKTLEETDGTAFDLSNVKLGEGVSTIKFKNPNAIIQVAGKEENQIGIPTADWGDTKNVVVKRDNWYFPAKQLEITDKEPVFTSYFISGQVGFKCARQLKANTSNTVYLPIRTNAEVPDGCKAYEMVQGDDANTIKLNEVTKLNERTHYIVYNGNSEDVTLNIEQTAGDVDFRNTEELPKTMGNLTAKGNFSYFEGNGTQYGLQNETGSTLTLKKIDGGTICPFRVYFTVAEGADAKAITFTSDNEITGINDIKATDAAKAGNIYSIDGKLVKANATSTEGLAKGVYILNGKKVIVK